MSLRTARWVGCGCGPANSAPWAETRPPQKQPDERKAPPEQPPPATPSEPPIPSEIGDPSPEEIKAVHKLVEVSIDGSSRAA